MVQQFSDNKITEIWMCALNYEGCIVEYMNGKKEAIGPDTIKQILKGYKQWLDEQQLVAKSSGMRIDDRLTKYLSTLGISCIQFI